MSGISYSNTALYARLLDASGDSIESNNNALNVLNNTIESSSNSSTTTLTSGSYFTGTAEQNKYTDVLVFVITDKAGQLLMEFSPDGTNWDESRTHSYDPTNINIPYTMVKGMRYYRTRFQNTAASSQTYFRIKTYYGSFNKLSIPVGKIASQLYDATLTRPTDFFTEITEGKREGYTAYAHTGETNTSYTNTDVTIWPLVADSVPNISLYLTSATVLRLRQSDSTSLHANDRTTGTGARTVLISGVDTDKKLQTETVSLTSTTVDTTKTWLGVNSMQVATAGTALTNAGSIALFPLTSGDNTKPLIKISVGESTSHQLFFNVPSTTDDYIKRITVAGNKLSNGVFPVMTIKLWKLYNGVQYLLKKLTLDVEVNHQVDEEYRVPIKIEAGSIWWMTVNTDTASTVVRGHVEHILITV